MIAAVDNDAQLVTTIGHELAHILMSHDADYVAPFKITDFTDLSASELKKTFQACYKLEELKTFNIYSAKKYLDIKHDEIDKIRNDFISYQSLRFNQLRKRGYDSKDLVNCRTLNSLKNRISSIVNEVEKTDRAIDDKKWIANLASFRALAENPEINEAIRQLDIIFDNVAGEFEDGQDSASNWKEQEADMLEWRLFIALVLI